MTADIETGNRVEVELGGAGDRNGDIGIAVEEIVVAFTSFIRS